MGKFAGIIGKGKGIFNNMLKEGMPVLLVTGGVIVGQKFLDFKSIFPNVSPDKWYMKHEGAIKFGGAVITLAIWQKCPIWVKWLIVGVGIQGAIKEIRMLSMNDAGKAFFEQIGDKNEYSDAINAAANKIIDFAANTSQTGVGSPDIEGRRRKPNTSSALSVFSSTGVSGMGIGNDLDYAA